MLHKLLIYFSKSTQYKNKWAKKKEADWRRAGFPKVATLEPGGRFKHSDLHKVQSLEVSLDTLSLSYCLAKFIQKVAKLSKERYTPRTLYQIVCGIRRFIKEKNEKGILILSMLRTKDAMVLLYGALVIITFRFGDLNNCK